MTPKKVALIMINYKTYAERFLGESYESLSRVNYPPGDWRLYIVDNVTSEETRALCQKLAPEAKVIGSGGNGWGHANNVGARAAERDGFDDYIFIVNMDTEFDPDFINEAIRVYESDDRIGVVQSKLLLHPPKKNGEYMLNSAGNSLTFLGFGYSAGDGKPDHARDKVVDVNYASGAALLISGELFKRIGRCDESYFMYHDDAEISFKAKLLRKRVVLAPRSIVYHKHEFGRSILQIYHMERNRMRFLLEFYKWPTLLLILPAFLLMELGMLPYAVKNKWLLAKLRIYGYFLNPKNWRFLLKKRREVQSLRKVSDHELLRGVIAVVDFQQVDNPLLRYIANPLFSLYWALIKPLIRW